MHPDERVAVLLALGFLLTACGGSDAKRGVQNEGGASGSSTDIGGSGAGGTQDGLGGASNTGGSLATGGNSNIGGASDMDAGDAGPSCDVGVAQSPAAPGSLDLFGQISYFGDGQALPPGSYRVTYVDGCMKYSSTQDWAIHAYQDGSIAWFLGTTSGDKLQMLPGTVGITEGAGGFADFDACVAANKALPPIEFTFAGGALGIWLADSLYSDNVAGIDGRNPSWRLERLGSCQ